MFINLNEKLRNNLNKLRKDLNISTTKWWNHYLKIWNIWERTINRNYESAANIVNQPRHELDNRQTLHILYHHQNVKVLLMKDMEIQHFDMERIWDWTKYCRYTIIKR